MAIIGDALRQAFMPKREYESLRDEDKAWLKLQRPALLLLISAVCGLILACTIVSLNIVFPGDDGVRRPFCGVRRVLPLSVGDKGGDAESFPGAFYLTDAETVDYFWLVVFVPSAIIFAASAVYLGAGIIIAYSAPTRHWCLKVVENNYCASRRGGVRCLSILNVVFAIIFGLLAIFLGSSLLTLGSSCSVPLFWCYEISTWGLVVLYGGTAFFLKRKAAVILDAGEYGSRTLGLEMLEANPLEVTPDVERRVNEGFKSWMGPSLLSSDEEDEPESYMEVPQPNLADFNGQRV
ncbi:hypothetical protein NL676_033926 [Syzygium grande]|nr:hypothetical protein NL676_033926 [Syzygium grande]